MIKMLWMHFLCVVGPEDLCFFAMVRKSKQKGITVQNMKEMTAFDWLTKAEKC